MPQKNRFAGRRMKLWCDVQAYFSDLRYRALGVINSPAGRAPTILVSTVGARCAIDPRDYPSIGTGDCGSQR